MAAGAESKGAQTGPPNVAELEKTSARLRTERDEARTTSQRLREERNEARATSDRLRAERNAAREALAALTAENQRLQERLDALERLHASLDAASSGVAPITNAALPEAAKAVPVPAENISGFPERANDNEHFLRTLGALRTEGHYDIAAYFTDSMVWRESEYQKIPQGIKTIIERTKGSKELMEKEMRAFALRISEESPMHNLYANKAMFDTYFPDDESFDQSIIAMRELFKERVAYLDQFLDFIGAKVEIPKMSEEVTITKEPERPNWGEATLNGERITVNYGSPAALRALQQVQEKNTDRSGLGKPVIVGLYGVGISIPVPDPDGRVEMSKRPAVAYLLNPSDWNSSYGPLGWKATPTERAAEGVKYQRAIREFAAKNALDSETLMSSYDHALAYGFGNPREGIKAVFSDACSTSEFRNWNSLQSLAIEILGEGYTLITPRAGDRFDYNFHIQSNDAPRGDGERIEKVLVPGIRGPDGKSVVTAEVTTRKLF